MENKVFIKKIVWIHGFNEVSCPKTTERSACIHYDSLVNQPWPKHSRHVIDSLKKLEEPCDIYAYSLGGLITLQALLDEASLHKNIASLTLIATPLYGVSIASGASHIFQSILSMLFLGVNTSKLDKLMASLQLFSGEIMSLNNRIKGYAWPFPVQWVVGLHNKYFGSFASFCGDGLVSACLAHGASAQITFSQNKVMVQRQNAQVTFCLHHDHQSIKGGLEHIDTAHRWCGYPERFEVYFLCQSEHVKFDMTRFGPLQSSDHSKIVTIQEQKWTLFKIVGGRQDQIKVEINGQQFLIPSAVVSYLSDMPRLIWVKVAK